ncbi:MAG: 4'-phosphopantetheinyl transferase superfamily protein [Proteobacteria bacterium]|nr:4'-phosphopantetheinyl transferase superfamily protein [Pseudomonadota bacterium]
MHFLPRPLGGEGRGEGVDKRHALAGQAPSPLPSPASGRGRDRQGVTAAPPRWLAIATTPLPPRGGGAGGEGALPAQERTQARQQIRAALIAELAQEIGCAPQALQISHERGQPPRLRQHGRALPIQLSISHAPGLSLAAWCRAGSVGVDVQAVPRDATAAELLRTAALFLEPKRLATLTSQAQNALFLEAFARHWARHEAALKCAGQALVEYTPALAARLAGVRVTSLALPAWAAADRVAALAWRPASAAITAP